MLSGMCGVDRHELHEPQLDLDRSATGDAFGDLSGHRVRRSSASTTSRVPAVLPTNASGDPYESTVFVQVPVPISVGSGGGTATVFLNGIMLSGGGNDIERDEHLAVEFHTT
jgi:hypothetical protein